VVTSRSEPGIDRLAFQGEYAEDTFMDTSQRFSLHEPLEGFHAYGELTESKRALGAETSGAKTFEMFGRGVLRSVDDAKVFSPSTLHRGLHQATSALSDELERLHDHSLAP